MNYLRFRSAATAIALLAAVAASASSARADGKKFLRFVDNGNDHQLQTSIVHFQNADGVKVDLVGAVHVADRSYFDQLNKRFKGYDALLYEMVKPKGMVGIGQPTTAEAAAGAKRHSSNSWVSFIQRFMTDQLQLEFQLDRIDYNAPNFVHADLDAETFVERQEARGESMLTLMLNQMLHELSKPAAAAGDKAAEAGQEMGLMDLVQALQAPDRARQLKLVMGRQFENMDDALDAMGGPDGSVILTERNAHAMSVLKEQITAGKKNLAVFFGAAHLKGMEAIMTKDMDFKQVGKPEWIVAWDLADTSAHPAPKAIEPADAPATTQPAAQ